VLKLSARTGEGMPVFVKFLEKRRLRSRSTHAAGT
jgi:hypothetical protein